MKTLAVMIPVFNSEKYLKECLDSIFNQTFQDFDIHILDDFSIDSTVIILSEYKTKYPEKLYLHKNEKNEGIIYSRNKLLNICKKEYKYLAKMDSDDICNLKRFEIQVNFLEENKNIDVVSSNIINIPTNQKINYHIYNEYLKEALIFTNIINNSSSLFRSQILDRNNIFYDEEYKGASDYKFWLDISQKGYKFYILKDYLIKYRLHNNQESNLNWERQTNNGLRLVQNNLKLVNVDIKDYFLKKVRNLRLFNKEERQQAINFYDELYKSKLIKKYFDERKFKKMIKYKISEVLANASLIEKLNIFKYIDIFDIQHLRYLTSCVFFCNPNKSPTNIAFNLLSQISDDKQKDIIVYATNEISANILQMIEEKLFNFKIEAIIDSYVPKEGRQWKQYLVLLPSSIKEFTSKTIVIASENHKDNIIKTLKSTLLEDFKKYKIIKTR
ncbi:glycosyltransferase [Aliarcobacter cryaerophilus]|uniref:glycosyltransferase family 2 protein n=1 Tax=Aliarcobacter cryaerophilus TaxID=28198 RepID=UPI0021B5C3ED|nr:glycosyltransferase [Aliarcobacter cryaerophilus]MCT7528312.1 glycosyltransferase [Aliarcobacter cryaerophilus]